MVLAPFGAVRLGAEPRQGFSQEPRPFNANKRTSVRVTTAGKTDGPFPSELTVAPKALKAKLKSFRPYHGSSS